MNNFDIFKYGWKGLDTSCGWGSRLEHTNNIRNDLPKILTHINIGEKIPIVNDAGCGDLWWIKTLNLKCDYVGYDMFPQECWKELPYKCIQLNICEETMRKCDLIICRDVFIHWPNDYIIKALNLFKESGKYLYSTSYTGEYYQFHNNDRIKNFSLHHSKLNLCSLPFDLGKPLHITKEDYQEGFSQKVICLWKLKES